MNEELQKALATAVTQAVEGLKTGGEFVITQAPDVIQQLLRWKFWEATFWAMWGLLLVGIGMYIWRRIRKASWWKDACAEFNPLVVAAMIPVFLTGMGLIVFFSHATIALQIYLAPKIYLIEWATSRVTGGG